MSGPTIMKTAELQVGRRAVESRDRAGQRHGVRRHRKDQKAVKITGLKGTPMVSPTKRPWARADRPRARAVRKENSGSPNWVDGTMNEVDTATHGGERQNRSQSGARGDDVLGTPKAPKARLAHPRSIVITTTNDATDTDEFAYVTEFFGQATAAEAANGANSDTRKTGVLYRVKLSDKSVTTVNSGRSPTLDSRTRKSQTVGCFPNQVQNIGINGKFAYIVSICESPAGPTGPEGDRDGVPERKSAIAAGFNLVDGACVAPNAGQAAVCVDLASVKTTTAPLVSVVDISLGAPAELPRRASA